MIENYEKNAKNNPISFSFEAIVFYLMAELRDFIFVVLNYCKIPNLLFLVPFLQKRHQKENNSKPALSVDNLW
jgi:hypothetical protein